MANPVTRFFTKSFLERSQRLIGLAGIGFILGGSAFALLLTGGVFARTYKVTAMFTDAAGIQPGDKVTVAGLPAGTVKALRIEHGQVAIDLAVNKSVSVPADSDAEVVIETLLGRRAISLVAGQSEKELEDGSVIPVDRTTTPIDITQLNDISVRLMNASDAAALNGFLGEVTKVTTGKKDQVRQIVTGLNSVLDAVDSRKQQLGQLIAALRKVFTTLGERDKTILGLIDHLDPVLANLAERQEDLKTLLQATDSASHETADLVIRNRKVLDSTLNSLHQVLTILDRHQLDLAASLSYLNDSVEGYQSVGYSQGVPNRWANIFVQSLGPVGVDTLLGQCGLIDQLIDQMLGTDCQNSSPAGSGGTGAVLPPLPGSTPPLPGQLPTGPLPLPTGPLPLPTGGLPLPLPSPSLGLPATIQSSFPSSVGDLVDGVLWGWKEWHA
jgi:phospholipid/cholesterol/gamma-HCH transport system substrate-binding protein